jgi:hypothetical protein
MRDREEPGSAKAHDLIASGQRLARSAGVEARLL